MAGFLVLGAAACGDDDATTETDAGSESDRDAAEPEPTTDEVGDVDDGEGSDGGADDDTDAAESALPTLSSQDICDRLEGAGLDANLGALASTEPGDDEDYSDCRADFADGGLGVSILGLDDISLGLTDETHVDGENFDQYVESLTETYSDLAPIEGIGDAAAADSAGHAYVLVDGSVIQISVVGAADQIADVAQTVTGALTAA